MKKFTLLFSIFFIAFLVACSEDEVTPNERFDTYIKQWNDYEFEKMHAMFSTEAKETYPAEESVDRYAKIYEDLTISDLEVSFKPLKEEQLESAMKEGTAIFPFSVQMESIAGPINFEYEATLVKQGEEDDENWFVQWDPGFIFPQIKDGGEINLRTEPPIRGEIQDRNQMPLAMNATVYEVGIVPEKLGDNPEASKDKIAGLIGMSKENIDSALNAGWVEPHLFVRLKTIHNEDLQSQLIQVDGVMIDEVTGRVYPSGEAAAHLVGNIGQITAEEIEESEPGIYGPNDMIGKRGLEKWYEERLKGEKGTRIIVSKDGEEDVILAEKEVKNGENVTLTIDIIVQERVYESFGEDAGTAAAIDPKSGETLALVSSPAFDPNEILHGTTQNLWEELQNDENEPMLNRFSATFAPGSVLKPVTAAIGLQNGTIDADEGIEIQGKTWSNGEGWGDYEVRRVSESSGPVDLSNALIRSDNIYFAMKAVEMGNEAFVSGLENFGFGEDMPFEYPISTSTVSSSGTIDDEVSLANASYGQGELEISALHLALTYTAFLNDGNMIQPTLLTSEETGQIWKEELISADQAHTILDDLRSVVTEGTASIANIDDLSISGKTGTAELKLTSDDDSGKENGWFVGYPTDDQDILVAMMVEDTKDRGGSSYTVEKVIEILKNFK
ncbi:penicillin-binding transpeptidase domain-containing protein [Virgibacillus sp. C22-A2]|uniref:serine-type D-Ala-D-Ala carboxypeptidase n=1 Tax=Virgibacillus tibetensis TaxID=3042313 RepID=A0ABU6KDC4_9BACI|nr:penicillin-binding transpeptidase domain-containing protein [Virgibacillus sp. C22-A2]